MKTAKIVFVLLVAAAIVIGTYGIVYNNLRPIVVYGDTRTNHDDHRRVVAAICKTDPKVVFHTGDLVEDGRVPEQWDIFNEITAPMMRIAQFYPALGNHEYSASLYFDNFNLPGNERWYAVKRDGICFIILDSNNDLSASSEQRIWLQEALKKAARRARFTAVLFHHPIFHSGGEKKDEKGLERELVPLFERYGVDIVFCGHAHHYERLERNGIYYIITGGGGAPLYGKVRDIPFSKKFIKRLHFCKLRTADDTIMVEVVDVGQKVIDTFTVLPGSE